MAKRVNRDQSTKEKLIYPIDWTDALLEGVTVDDVTITLPEDLTATFDKEIDSPISYIKSPAGLPVGTHLISVVAITDNVALQPEVLLAIKVER